MSRPYALVLNLMLPVFLAGFAAQSSVAAEKPEVLDKATIHGDRELPNVMYFVPWRRPELGDLVSKPVKSLLDESITPLDRDVFIREIDYYETLHPQEFAGSRTQSEHPQ